MARKRTVPLRWEKIAVFSFGVVFISVLMVLVLLIPRLTPEAYTVFRIVIALATAEIGAAIPVFLDVEMKGLIRAGGAMALFVVVYFFSPAAPTLLPDPPLPPNPAESPERAITEWLSFIDSEDYHGAWAVSSRLSKASYDQKAFLDVFNAQRKPLGKPDGREPYGLQSPTVLPDGRKGNFRLYTYKTKFLSGQQLHEVIWLTAEDNNWKVLNYNLVPVQK